MNKIVLIFEINAIVVVPVTLGCAWCNSLIPLGGQKCMLRHTVDRLDVERGEADLNFTLEQLDFP